MDAEFMAKLFHDTYERLAPDFDYKTRKASAKPWFEVPENNRKLMIAVAEKILAVQKRMTEDNWMSVLENAACEAETIERVVDIFCIPKGWRRKLIRWLWPETEEISEVLRRYCWKDCK